MPSNFLSVDTGMPDLGKNGGSVEERLRAVQNYLYMLLENLRYVLRNLSPENFNEAETLDWLGKNIKAETVISNTVITNELYADYGAVADLTVDRLRTDYERAYRYLNSNTAPLNYIYIHDEVIEFWTATTDGTQTQQLTDNGHTFYWTDETMTQMTYLKATPYPVMVYVYNELLKGSIRFTEVTYQGVTTKVPQIVLGAGYGLTDADRGKGFIQKNTESFDIWFKNDDGDLSGVFLGDDATNVVGPKIGANDSLGVYMNKPASGSPTVDIKGPKDSEGNSVGVFMTNSSVSVVGPENSGGNRIGVYMGSEYTDIVGMRKTTQLDFSGWSNGGFTETVDGNITVSYGVEFDANGYPVLITDEDGHETEVVW